MTLQQVTISQFQNAIIAAVYDKFAQNGMFVTFNRDELIKLAQQTDMDTKEIPSQMRQLENLGLMTVNGYDTWRAGWHCFDAYERNTKDEKVFANNKIRRLIIEKAHEARNNTRGGFADSDEFYADERTKELSQDAVYANVWFLKEAGHLEASLMTGNGFMYRLVNFPLATDSQVQAEILPISLDEYIRLDTIGNVIQAWTPRQKRRLEESYKAELAEYLRSHGFPKTREEEGQSNPDILVEEILPVEMKKDPGQGELDRMSGQMLRMLNEFDRVIACIIQTSSGLDRIERFKKGWEGNPKVRVIIKEH